MTIITGTHVGFRSPRFSLYCFSSFDITGGVRVAAGPNDISTAGFSVPFAPLVLTDFATCSPVPALIDFGSVGELRSARFHGPGSKPNTSFSSL